MAEDIDSNALILHAEEDFEVKKNLKCDSPNLVSLPSHAPTCMEKWFCTLLIILLPKCMATLEYRQYERHLWHRPKEIQRTELLADSGVVSTKLLCYI